MGSIIAYDLGTGGNKASLYDAGGACLESTFVPYETTYPRTGWHEQRPADWWRAVLRSTRSLIDRRPGEAKGVQSISISGHSLGAVPLDAHGAVLRDTTPIWSDTRAEAQVERFFCDLDPGGWYMRTGNGFPAACYTVFKIMWYRDNEPEMFTSAVSIFAAGSALKWVRDTICTNLVEQAEEQHRDPYDLMSEAAARSPVGARRLLFNPSLAGGTSQEGSPHIRGAYVGLDLGHRQEDLIRASFEGIALNLGAVLDLLKRYTDLGESGMVMVGGGSKSSTWLQIFADVYEMDIVKTNVDQDAGSLGAAALGAVGCGLWKNFDRIDEIHRVQARFSPIPENVRVYRALRPVFQAVRDSQAAVGDILHGLEEP